MRKNLDMPMNDRLADIFTDMWRHPAEGVQINDPQIGDLHPAVRNAVWVTVDVPVSAAVRESIAEVQNEEKS
jgi:hypothetical protein